MSKFYQIHQFAELAGVTVKALHHYDRLGLLQPKRTDARYRLYTARDLERLEQIVALKFLGLPLKKIKQVLDQGAMELSDALRVQRRALEDKRRLLTVAIRAIQEAEQSIEPNKPADPLILKKLIEVISMQDGIEAMKKYYSDEAWARHRRHYEEEPSADWKALYRDVEAALNEDPAGEKGQELAGRWTALLQRDTAYDPQVIAGMMKAWMDRRNWPSAIQQQAAVYNLEQVRPFIQRAILALQKRTLNDDEKWAKLMERAQWNTLLFEANLAVDDDPSSERAQALAARMEALLGLGGAPTDTTVIGLKQWMSQQECSKYQNMIDPEKVAGLLGNALDLRRKTFQPPSTVN